jgi:hypothetical protein
MAKKKAKKAEKRRRRPNPKVWALPQFKALLDENGCLSCAGLKIMVENQRDINTKLYESIEAAIETLLADRPHRQAKSSPLSRALALVRTVPGSGPPECKSDALGEG